MSVLPDVADPAPDHIHPIIGYRQWRLVDGALTSVFNDTRWEHAQITARCDSRAHHPELVPDHACSCGVLQELLDLNVIYEGRDTHD